MGITGGQGGIRTLGTVARTPHFECGAFNHSTTCPRRVIERVFANGKCRIPDNENRVARRFPRS